MLVAAVAVVIIVGLLEALVVLVEEVLAVVLRMELPELQTLVEVEVERRSEVRALEALVVLVLLSYLYQQQIIQVQEQETQL
jgi:hypothetical protein